MPNAVIKTWLWLHGTERTADWGLLIWKGDTWFPASGVCLQRAYSPAVSLSGVIWALVFGTVWASSARCSCPNMTGSQAARRHRSLVSNRWKGNGSDSSFTGRKLWTGKMDAVFFFLYDQQTMAEGDKNTVECSHRRLFQAACLWYSTVTLSQLMVFLSPLLSL